MDSMHIEANVSKNLLHTILGMLAKDLCAVQLNFQAYNVQRPAWCIPGCPDLPPEPWILGPKEKQIFMS
jgi:hypothetical protein